MNLMILVEELAKNMKIDSVKSEYENVISINLGDFEVFFSYMETRKAIMIHASLGVHDNNKESLAYLLAMNNMYTQTQGLCLGIDGQVITAQQNIFVSAEGHSPISTEIFLEQCEMFFAAVAELLPFLNDSATFQKAIAEASATTQGTGLPSGRPQDIRC